MATVIKRGYYEYTHKVCKSVISFEVGELKSHEVSDYTGDVDYYRSLVCPACGTLILFPRHGEPC